MAVQKAIYATGRRKTSSARVYLKKATGESEDLLITVNKKHFRDYFPRKTAQMLIAQPLEIVEATKDFAFTITVSGGGISGQAGAVRHGIARALEKQDKEMRPALKKEGFLTRDQRSVERKKPGRHKARKKPQFSKR